MNKEDKKKLQGFNYQIAMLNDERQRLQGELDQIEVDLKELKKLRSDLGR